MNTLKVLLRAATKLQRVPEKEKLSKREVTFNDFTCDAQVDLVDPEGQSDEEESGTDHHLEQNVKRRR